MSERLPRSNSQSYLPNSSQGQPDDKNTNVGNDKNGAPAQSDKKNGQGRSETSQPKPQMKSKEEKKEKESSESDPDNGNNSLTPFQRQFPNAFTSEVAGKNWKSAQSPSEDGATKSEGSTLKSSRQQQPDKKEKTANNKVPKLLLNIGNAFASITSDRREMAISPRKTKRETHRDTQDSNSSISSAAESGGKNTKNTATTTREKVNIIDLLKKDPDQPVCNPRELARIVITAESNEGKIHLTKSNAETMFRSGSPKYQGKPLGASYRQPFMRSCFLKPGLINIVQEMQENYTAIKKTGNFESKSLKEKAESVWEASEKNLDSVFQHRSVMDDFLGITKPLAAKINGAESNISTSLLPARFLHFLLELDREIVRWHQETPDGPEKLSDSELRTVRQNAISNYLGVYGPYATIILATNEVKSEKKILDNDNPYVLLENVLSKRISEPYGKFLSSVMDCTDDQYLKIEERSNQEQRKIADDIEARKLLSVNRSESHFAQSPPPDNAHSNNSTTTATTTNTTTTTTTTTVTETTTTSTKKSERVAPDTVNKSKKDPRRSPARLAAAAVNAVKESKKYKKKEGDKFVSASLKPSSSSLQQVFRDKGIVDGVDVFKEFIVPYMVSNLKQKNVVSLGEKMYEKFHAHLEEYSSLNKKALDEKRKTENLVVLSAEKRSQGLTEEADAMLLVSKNFSANAKKFEDAAQALLNPIVKPVLDYFSPTNLINILPEQLLDFLALCDKELTDWMRAESVGMTEDEIITIRIRGLTGLLMIRGLGALLQDEFSTSKNPALSEQENRKISGEMQKKYVPLQTALQRGFYTTAKSEMIAFLSFLEKRTSGAIGRSEDMEKDYKVARMQAGDDGQTPVSPRKRVKNSQISKDENSSVSVLNRSVKDFLEGHGLEIRTRLFNELADFLVTEFKEQKITDPSDVELAQLTTLYIEYLRDGGEMTQQRLTALEALEKSIHPLLPEAEDANRTPQNSVKTEPATPPATVTITSVGEINRDYLSVFFDLYNLIRVDPDSCQMILQRVGDEFTEKLVVATLDDVTKISIEILEEKMVQLSQAGDPRVQQLEEIIADLKGLS
jgi:hypothetical protein